MSMIERLAATEARYNELDRLLADPATLIGDYSVVSDYARERSQLEPLVEGYHRYLKLSEELADAQALLESEPNADLRAMAAEETESLQSQLAALEQSLTGLLIPRDPRDDKNVIVEIRAGAGGDEAGLFAADLLRMYLRYAEDHHWKTEVMSQNESGIGGYKEVVLEIRGRGAFSRLKYESGVHRVQRVPMTEAQGRIHTSTTTVAVLAEVGTVDIAIADKDISIDSFRSSGAGGQNVQKNETAIRITHHPTGLVVTCQNERSRMQNLETAMNVLRARLYDLEMGQRLGEQDAARKSQVGSGERSEKIRTYNYPQSRVTDHRIGLSSYNLPAVLDGELDTFIDQLALNEQTGQLSAAPVDDHSDD